MSFSKIVPVAAAVAALCLVIVACGDSSSPVSPRSVTAGVSAIFPEPTPTPTPTPPPGEGCSPGYWKNHESHFNSVCAAAAALPGDAFTSCAQLLTAITCQGNEAGCTGDRRQAAAAALNTVSGCTETD
jgi:hypothetical protein